MKTFGIIKYSILPEIKVWVELDSDLSGFYRYLIPKQFNIKKPKFNTHISVVRNEIIKNIEFWYKYKDLKIEIEYDNYIYIDSIYSWLNVHNLFLEQLRVELGLNNHNPKITCPPIYNEECFHITIGNFK